MIGDPQLSGYPHAHPQHQHSGTYEKSICYYNKMRRYEEFDTIMITELKSDNTSKGQPN
jgi:hypothetical protein